MKHIRYEGLDELRALAALVIIPGHIEQFKELFGMQHYYWFPIPGKLGVVLFFVLSGFLITTLLLKEKDNFQNIDLKKFYLRRMARIWPLYFLIMGASILVFNQISILQMPELSQRALDSLDPTSIMLIVLILPNLLVYPVHPIPYAAHSWSIGIEEQFYLLQPLLVKFVNDYRVQIMVLLIIVFSKELVSYFLDGFDSKYYHKAVSQLVFFGCIAIGCISAILYLKQHKFIQLVVYNKHLQRSAYILLLIFLVFIYKTNKESVVDFRFHAIIFAIVILNAATNPLSVVKFKNKILAYLGRISYGIYMYHPISIGVAIAITNYMLGTSGNLAAVNILVYLLSFVFTFFISAISFKYYEGYFLKLKKRYEL